MPQAAESDLLVRTISADVGGICNYCSTNSISKISLGKKHYTFGETVTVTINCNNSACAKDIKSFKVQLYRKHWFGSAYNLTNPKKGEILVSSEEFKGLEKH